MSGTIQNATTSAFDASKTALAPIIASLHSASALGGKAFLAASGTSYTLLHSLVEKDRTGLLRIAVSRLEAGDKAAWLALGSSVLIGYIGLCNALRFRRRDKMKKELGYYTREEMKNMTTTEAQRVIVNMSEMEFPLVYMTSIEFALFKTYGIPTISKLLSKTNEFNDDRTKSKRLADTAVLVGEFVSHPPTTPRPISAIARMNYLHAPYIAAGSISQDDLLYTASVFMTEPVRWVERYEWRSTSEYEKCAIGVFWREMMDSMMIDYQSRLSGGSFSTKDKKEWKDGIEFWDDVADWARKYEEKYMVPAQSNKKTGDATASMLLDVVPEGLKEAAMKVIAVVMEPRLRRSMMYADPPESYVSTISTIFSIRRFVLRYLVLPRPEFMRARILTEPDKKTGRLRYTHYKDRPYYVQPTFWNRWGPEALMWRLMGGVVPGGKDGEKYMPQGYLFEEIGPRRVVGRGKETTDKFEENIRMVRKGGCPFPH